MPNRISYLYRWYLNINREYEDSPKEMKSFCKRLEHQGIMNDNIVFFKYIKIGKQK